MRQSLLFFLGCMAAALLLTSCDQQRIEKLEEGVATEADVRRQFGEPTQITERADGSKWLEYPRQPEGTTNYMITIGADGKMSSLRQLLTSANAAKVQPGMDQGEVRRTLGLAAKKNRYAMKPDEEAWEWHFMDGPKKRLLTVTFGADAKVMSTAITEDMRDSTPK